MTRLAASPRPSGSRASGTRRSDDARTHGRDLVAPHRPGGVSLELALEELAVRAHRGLLVGGHGHREVGTIRNEAGEEEAGGHGPRRVAREPGGREPHPWRYAFTPSSRG